MRCKKKITHRLIEYFDEFELSDTKTFKFQTQYIQAINAQNVLPVLQQCCKILAYDYYNLNYCADYGINSVSLEATGKFSIAHNGVVSYIFEYLYYSGGPYLFFQKDAFSFDIDTGQIKDYIWELANIESDAIQRNLFINAHVGGEHITSAEWLQEIHNHIDQNGYEHYKWYLSEKGIICIFETINALGDYVEITVPWNEITN